MKNENYFIESAPIPLILHAGPAIIATSHSFKKLTGCQNAAGMDLRECLSRYFNFGDALDLLLKDVGEKKEFHTDMVAYIRGYKTKWEIFSFPLNYANDTSRQITWFIDKTYKDVLNAYWGLQIQVNVASSSIVRKDIELNKFNIELKKINKQLEMDIIEREQAEEKLKNAYEQLRAMQDQLIQAEKLNAVGQLASGVAHEVRNPLGIIIQGINYLERRLPTDEGDIFETLSMLKDSVRRADKIINALLDFSKATALGLQHEDINSILESSLILVKNQVKFESIEIAKELKRDMPKVLADKNKIEQVCVNILLNAVQAMPKGGKIAIRSYDKRLGQAGNGVGSREADHFKVGERAVIVEFEDSGIGISEEHLKKIFDPFFTTKGPKGGTGLGLSVSRNILHMHKGLIYAESRVGRGTKITVVLKAAEES